MQIHYAAGRADCDAIRSYLPDDLEARDAAGHTPLMLALDAPRHDEAQREAARAAVTLLLEAGADVNARADDGTTPLHAAARRADPAIVRQLLAAGADASATTEVGYSVLIDAIYARADTDTIRALLAAGADPNMLTDYGEIAICIASAAAAFDTVVALIEGGAEETPLEFTPQMRTLALTDEELPTEALETCQPELRDHGNRRLLDLAICARDGALLDVVGAWHQAAGGVGDFDTGLIFAAHHGSATGIAWMLKHGANVDAVDDFGNTALIVASEYGKTECVRALIAAGATIDKSNEVETQAIDVADNLEIAQALVAAGADIDYVNGQGTTVLQDAAASNTAFAAGLLELGADVDATRAGKTALHEAAEWDNVSAMRLLLEHGADVNAQDADEWTPLSYAKSLEAARVLLDAGARTDLEDEVGDTVFQQHKEIALLELFLELGADIDVGQGSGGTALHRAARDGDPDRLRFLLDRGASIEATNEFDDTALMLAAEYGHETCVQLLLDKGAPVDAVDHEGRTALFRAAAPEGSTGFEVANILATGHDPDLFAADPELAELLASQSAEDGLGLEDFGFVASDSTATLEMLLAAGADLEHRDDDGVTSLMLTAACGRPARLAALLQHGAHRETKDDEGRTALDHTKNHPDQEFGKVMGNILRS